MTWFGVVAFFAGIILGAGLLAWFTLRTVDRTDGLWPLGVIGVFAVVYSAALVWFMNVGHTQGWW